MEGAERWVKKYERGDKEVKVALLSEGGGERVVGIDKDVMVDGYLFGLVEETKRMNGLDVTSTCFKYPKLSCSPHLHDSGSHFCCCFFPGICFHSQKAYYDCNAHFRH